jgi:hypothetical protein
VLENLKCKTYADKILAKEPTKRSDFEGFERGPMKAAASKLGIELPESIMLDK